MNGNYAQTSDRQTGVQRPKDTPTWRCNEDAIKGAIQSNSLAHGPPLHVRPLLPLPPLAAPPPHAQLPPSSSCRSPSACPTASFLLLPLPLRMPNCLLPPLAAPPPHAQLPPSSSCRSPSACPTASFLLLPLPLRMHLLLQLPLTASSWRTCNETVKHADDVCLRDAKLAGSCMRPNLQRHILNPRARRCHCFCGCFAGRVTTHRQPSCGAGGGLQSGSDAACRGGCRGCGSGRGGGCAQVGTGKGLTMRAWMLEWRQVLHGGLLGG